MLSGIQWIGPALWVVSALPRQSRYSGRGRPAEWAREPLPSQRLLRVLLPQI
jgi:hypothetical protein